MAASVRYFDKPTVTLRSEDGKSDSSQPLSASSDRLHLAIPKLFSPEQKIEAIEKGLPPILALGGTSLSTMTTQQALRIIKACPDHVPLGVRYRVNHLYREALKAQDETACVSLVKRGANRDMRLWKPDEARSNELHAAIRRIDLEIADAILSDLRREKVGLEQQLQQAVVANDTDKVRDLLAQGVDPNLKSLESGDAPLLSLAVYKWNPDMAKAFLEAGADPDSTDIQLCTAIYFAAYSYSPQRFEMVKMLLEAGADPNYSMNVGGDTPLHKAADHGDEATVRLLLEHGADPHQTTDNHFETPLNRVEAQLKSVFLSEEERGALERVANILKEAMVRP